MKRIIDPHIHLFNLESGDYQWLQAGTGPDWPDKVNIRRSFHESDLQPGAGHELAGFVHIEAGFDNLKPWRELAWLEQHCTLPYRSVAFAALNSAVFPQQLQQLQRYRSLVGIRFILDERAARLLGQPLFQQNLALLAKQGLLFEAQLSLSDQEGVNLLIEQMQANPALSVVINHGGFPRQPDQTWMTSVTRLGQQPSCSIKCSGWEMFDRHWNLDQVRPMISYAVREFGLSRVMLASNFPVSELGCSYAELWRRYIDEMPWQGFEREMLCYDNARRIYQLDL
ncbi:amidohydrolase family protein [Neptuniibacter halophilus]|uniref:amidohydrolase family protein n=1 Tax=Neptuniibacter halophilus TaxID=651666 RepID=UPI00257360BA|nr:amidohydrolase family protein [Neptuniibacter halophilus]